MNIHTLAQMQVAGPAAEPVELDLSVSIVTAGPVSAALLSSTDDEDRRGHRGVHAHPAGPARLEGHVLRSSQLAARPGRSQRLADLAAVTGARSYLCGTGGMK
jgi:hypothetical protein